MTSTEASSSEEKAATLRALHVPGDPLMPPNAGTRPRPGWSTRPGSRSWPRGSVATAQILGYDDGEAAPVEDLLAAAARIVRAVSLPVTQDSDPPTGEMIDAAEQADFLAAGVPRRCLRASTW